MSNLFKGVRCLTQEQYEQLKNDGTITIDGETYLFEEDWLYVTPEDVSDIARNNKKRLDSLTKDYEATKLVVAENKNNITLLKSNYTTISNDLREVKNDINDLIATSVTLEGAQTIKGPKTFTENIYLANADGTVDRISHINNNFIIYSGAEQGVALLNIDEGLDKIYAFNKELAFKEDITGASGSKVYVNNTLKDSVYFDDDPQLQLNNKLDKLESSDNKALVNVTKDGQLEKTEFTANHLHGLKEQDLSPSKNVLDLTNFIEYHPFPDSTMPGSGTNEMPSYDSDNSTGTITVYSGLVYEMPANLPVYKTITLKPNTIYTISGNGGTTYTGYVWLGTGVVGAIEDTLVDLQPYSTFAQTFTTLDETEYLIYFTSAAGGDTVTFSNLQLEEGETATDFEPYHDALEEDKVVYQSDSAVVFAETERQKSKNLLDLSSVPTTDTIKPNGTGLKIISAGNNLNTGGGTYDIHLSANKTYTISYNLRGNTQDQKMYIRWNFSDGEVAWSPNLEVGKTAITWTPSKDVVSLNFYLQYYETAGTYMEVTNLQIEEGNVATAYQPYNGKIVHEKDLESRVSKYQYTALWGGAISAGTVISINGKFNDYKAIMYRAIINDVTRLVHYHPMYELYGQFIFADDGQYVVFEYQSDSSIKIIAKSSGANWLQIFGVK